MKTIKKMIGNKVGGKNMLISKKFRFPPFLRAPGDSSQGAPSGTLGAPQGPPPGEHTLVLLLVSRQGGGSPGALRDFYQ